MPATKSKTAPQDARHLALTKALEEVPDPPATRSATAAERPDRSRLALWVAFVLLAVVVGGIGYFVWQGQSAEDEKIALLKLIDTECGPGGTDPSAPLCVATAPQRADDTVAAATATGVDAAQVIELVRAELAARPAEPGRTPSPDEVAGIVRGVLAANPDLYRGEQGRPGDPAPPPSDEQVQAAAAAVLAANPELYRGERGTDGASPPCLSEPGQCRGQDGEAPVQITQRYADGSTSVCTRDPGSLDTAPTYTCPPPSGGSTDPDPDPGSDPTPDPPAEDPPPAPDPDTAPGGLFG